MIAIIQRVTEASVTVSGETVAYCKDGLTVLLGVGQGDNETDAMLLAEKISKLRIFTDENGKMNLSVNDIGGSVMVVPNFTLYASYKKGNRPDFLGSAQPDEANRLFDFFCDYISGLVPDVKRGIFGAHMKFQLTNDGPVTIPMDSRVLRKQ